jgi:hypothetical protein
MIKEEFLMKKILELLEKYGKRSRLFVSEGI